MQVNLTSTQRFTTSNTLLNINNNQLLKSNNYGIILNLKTKQIDEIINIGQSIPNLNNNGYESWVFYTTYRNKIYASYEGTSLNNQYLHYKDKKYKDKK